MNLAFLSTEETRSLFRLFYYFLPYVAYEPQVTNQFGTEYDYIVAGAGSAGSVVASRLTEDPCVNVLLLEAGPKVDPLTEIPVAALLAAYMKNDWQFPTTTQKRDTGHYKNDQITSEGKGVGGSSLLNYMLYVRGNKRDFNQWEENGATGWGWKDVLPYFLKAENNTNPEIVKNGLHSTKGLLTVGTPQDTNPVIEAFVAAGKELGYEHLDINGPKQTGFAKMQGTIRNGRRCSTAKAYLIPAENRPNLDIVREAYVQKVLINNKKQAYGIRFEKDGYVYDINARKEVIMSLGAFNTPKTLMLSGIGPEDHLKNFGIKVLADLPVGNNLQNHVANAAITFTPTPADPVVSEIDLVKYAQRYEKNATGPFTLLADTLGYAFTSSKYIDPKMDWPDIKIVLLPTPPKVLKAGYEIPDQYKNDEEDHAITLYTNFLRPRSRGTVRLNSTDPYAYPLIDFNLLDSQVDLDRLVDSLHQVLQLMQTQAFKNIGAKLSTKKLAKCEQYELYSDDYLKCVAIEYVATADHYTCTCKMGSPDDETTVLDPQLRVKGIQNLRVVDGSVMPTIVSGNTNAAIIMIAEKASDLIKMDNPDRKKCS